MADIAVVTGASGFVATELVKQLLEKGYDVRGTVRSVANEEKVAHLSALGKALPGTLKLYEADLLKPDSFDSVVSGATYVFHTASPFIREVDDPQKDLVDPAVEGTKNVFSSIVKNKATIKRVVLTSSFAAVNNAKAGPSNPPRYTEADWNKESSLKDSPYRLSKTLAEKAAWEISKKESIDLVVINPTFVIGPILSARTDATSIKDVSAIVEGKDKSIMTWLCDVRDIARAHVLGAENASANGRYLVSQPDTVANKKLTDALKGRFPDIKIADGKDLESTPVIDNSKALNQLGLGKLYDPTQSIIDMAVTLIQKGVAKPQRV